MRYIAAGSDAETSDFHNNYHDDWLAWQSCMLTDAEGSLVEYDNAYRLSKEGAQELVEDVWKKYTPWMRDQFSQWLYSLEDDDDPDGGWRQLVLPEDWAPRLPLINKGNKKVKEHCDEDHYSCAWTHGFEFEERKRVGKSVWYWADRAYDEYAVWAVKVKYTDPARIVTPKQNRFVMLGHLAFLIDQWQFRSERTGTAAAESVENDRTGGHGLEFRCLAIDLYNNYVEDIDEIIPWWEDSYAELHRLCQVTAPGYAQLVPDDED